MIRLLIWRAGFELANVRRIIRGRGGDRCLYFAFGANLDPKVLEKERRIRPASEREFCLRGYEIRFTQTGPFRGQGFASISKAPTAVVYGKLYEISKVDALRLDYYEAVPFLRRYKRVEVEQDGVRLYFYASVSPREGLKPSPEYLGHLTTGLSHLKSVPEDYAKQLAETPVLVERIPVDDMGLVFEERPWMPRSLATWMRRLDRVAVYVYANYIRPYSFTERWIRHD